MNACPPIFFLVSIPWYRWMGGSGSGFGVFAARATIDADDTNLKGNTNSYYFMMVHVSLS